MVTTCQIFFYQVYRDTNELYDKLAIETLQIKYPFK